MIEIRSGETSYFCVGPYLQVWGLEKRSGMAHCRARGPPRRAFPPATPGTGTVIGCSFGQPSTASVTSSHLWAYRGHENRSCVGSPIIKILLMCHGIALLTF